MPSEPPKSSSSSAAKPSSLSTSAAKPSSSSSSSSSSKPAPTSGDAKPPQPTPVISANAWMSFFLFCCLVLIILQAPLGLGSGGFGASTIFGLPATPWGFSADTMGGLGGMPGCGGMVAGYVPWCQPPAIGYAQQIPMQMPPQQVIYAQQPPPPPIVIQEPVMERRRYHRDHQMGGQGQIATPGGGAGWSWYANPDGSDGGYRRDRREYRESQNPGGYRSVQYQRPGVQVQVTHGTEQRYSDRGQYQQQRRHRQGGAGPVVQDQYQSQGQGQTLQPVQTNQQPLKAVPPIATVGMANLENAFYPLLIGAIALLVLFDYAS